MTLVVTHTEGFLGCFTVEPDGSLRQRALIDTGSPPQTPQQLALLGTRLADEYGWQVNGHAVHEKKKQAPSLEAKQPVRRTPIKRAPHSEMRAWVLEYLATHPESSLREIATVRGEEWSNRTNAYYWGILDYLRSAGKVVKGYRKMGQYGTKEGIYSLKPLANIGDEG